MLDDLNLDQMLDAAIAWHESGQLDLAEANYRKVLQHNPHEPDALNLMGVILQERGELNESIALLNQALEIIPDFPEALANLSRVQRVNGAHAMAAAAAKRAIALDPELAEAHLQLGRTLLDLGDHAGAVTALSQATTLAPRSVDARLQLGAAHLRSGDYEAAAASLTAALSLVPDRTDIVASLALALTGLSRVHREAANSGAAVQAARRAAELDPTRPDPWLELGYARLLDRNEAGAVEALRKAIEIVPESVEAQIALATALTCLKDHVSASEAWQAALALKPGDPRLLIESGVALGELEHFDEALAAFREAETLAPGDPRTQHGIALCLVHTGQIAAAAELCRQALKTAPDWPALWTLLANCEAKVGHFTAAAESYRHSLALTPDSADVLHDLVGVGEGIDDDAAKHAACTILADRSKPVRDLVAAGFALGQLHDRDEAHDAAFTAYEHANRLLRADRAAHGFKFDRNNDRQLVDRLIATHTPETFVATAGWGDASDLPVFIVGMPRSGTSLVEQIAASHPRVFGAGERKDIHGILAALGGEQSAWCPVAWDRSSMRREAMSYVQRLRELGGDAIRVIDKLPINVMFLGQIAALFPRARIVVCRRDLRDVGLSCFFQYFRDDTMVWADDLGDCGFRGRQVERLMQHWRKIMPFPILEIQYETLVANLESESRRLIDFLGLEWDPACLSFHKTERAVSTASQWQVRQPLYSSSLGRWRHYRRHLGPLLRELDGIVPADDEDLSPPG